MRKSNKMWILYLLIFTLVPIHTDSPPFSPSSWKQMPAHVGIMMANIIQLLLTVIRGSLSYGAGYHTSPSLVSY